LLCRLPAAARFTQGCCATNIVGADLTHIGTNTAPWLLLCTAYAGITDAEETKSIEQWVLAIERGLNESQLRVYKVGCQGL
jgi:hypothetical protein